MRLNLRSRITIYFVGVVAAVIGVTVFAISWQLEKSTAEQAKLLAEELTRRSLVTVNVYHNIATALLDDVFHDIQQYGVSIAHKSPIAANIERQQHESIVDFLQTSLATGDIDFAFIFDQERALQASVIGPTAYKPGDKELPPGQEIFEAFPVSLVAGDILDKETRFQVSPRESFEREHGPGLHGLVGIEAPFLARLGIGEEDNGGKGGIAFVSSGIVRDEFLTPNGLYIVGKILNHLDKLLGDIGQASDVAAFLFRDNVLLTAEGLKRGVGEDNGNAPIEINPTIVKKVLDTSRPTNVVFSILGNAYSSSCTPINDVRNARIGMLCTGLPEDLIAKSQASLLEHGRSTEKVVERWIVGIGAAMFVVALFIAKALAGRITGPLEQLVAFTTNVGSGDHSKRMENTSPDEVGILSRSIDTMLDSLFLAMEEREKLEAQLRRGQKLEAVGTLAGGIAHDFNNILTAILGNIDLAAYDASMTEKTRRLLAEAEKASLRAIDLTQQLLTFAKGGEPIKEASSLENVVRDSAEFVLHGKSVACRYDIADDLWLVDIDKGQIIQVIQNIVLNASDAMPEGGVIAISCENSPGGDANGVPGAKEGNSVRIRIQDSGQGIRSEIIDRIFDPYFTTKQLGNGLGLAVTHSIVKKHGGRIEVQSSPGVGTTFTIYLPAAENQVVPESPAPARRRTSRKVRILVMDDEEVVRAVSQAMLATLGHDVVLAADGEAAVTLYRESMDAGDPFDLVIVDLTVPGGMGGKETVTKIHELDAAAKVVVSSGYSNDPVMAHFAEYGFFEAIAKPFRLEDVSRVISQILV